jgi:hypothetical protein
MVADDGESTAGLSEIVLMVLSPLSVTALSTSIVAAISLA